MTMAWASFSSSPIKLIRSILNETGIKQISISFFFLCSSIRCGLLFCFFLNFLGVWSISISRMEKSLYVMNLFCINILYCLVVTPYGPKYKLFLNQFIFFGVIRKKNRNTNEMVFGAVCAFNMTRTNKIIVFVFFFVLDFLDCAKTQPYFSGEIITPLLCSKSKRSNKI